MFEIIGALGPLVFWGVIIAAIINSKKNKKIDEKYGKVATRVEEVINELDQISLEDESPQDVIYLNGKPIDSNGKPIRGMKEKGF